ncbi:hypothetical protein [Leifsonia sp. 2MCAF36]|uniref:hypothetical protein n=1 Tax=Leifsonia sp. 2MCAF36 TaxID=3232988 RepID=UPI003F965CB7
MVAEEHDDSGRADGFDPRFDPSFQRGYQPQPGERPRTRVRENAPDAAYRRPSSVLQRPDERDRDPDRVAPAADDDTTLALADASSALARDTPSGRETAPFTDAAIVVGGPGLLARLELDPRRNPIILTLWIVGAGFVLLGIVLYCISVTSSYSGPTPSSDVGSLVFAQLGWMLAGPLITVGLLTLVGLLFLTALAGRRTREPVPLDDEL